MNRQKISLHTVGEKNCAQYTFVGVSLVTALQELGKKNDPSFLSYYTITAFLDYCFLSNLVSEL